jgi:DNA gyrase subunit B
LCPLTDRYFPSEFPTGEDIREGLTGILSVRLPEPYFEGATKSRLNNPEVESFVSLAVEQQLLAFLNGNPAHADAIFTHIREAATARKLATEQKNAQG